MTKDEAAKSLGVSPRTLNRLQTATGIKPHYSNPPGANYQVADYSDAQIETMKRFMNGQPVPNGFPNPNNGSTALASVTTQADAIATIDKTAANVALLAESIARAVEKSLKTPKVELTNKMVLSLAEASKLSGIPPRKLKAAQLNGSMLFWKDEPKLGRGYRVIRMNLESYILGLSKAPRNGNG